MSTSDWITLGGILVAAILGVGGIFATLVAGKPPEHASALLTIFGSKAVDFLLPILTTIGALVIAFGTTKAALVFFALAALLYTVRFLARPGPASRIEVFMLVLHCNVVGWMVFADLLNRTVDLIGRVK